MRRREPILKSLDWLTIGLYVLLVAFGWMSICGASYDYSEHELLDFSTRAGKQFAWALCSLGLAGVLMMLDDLFYEAYAYLIYGVMLVLLIVTIFIAPDTKGSHSWLILGPVSLQPAEFAKFATALALARCMSVYGFSLKNVRQALSTGLIILIPMLLIIAQRETGSALVYLAFFLVLYREGMPGIVLLAGLCAVLYFVVGIRFASAQLWDTPTPLGQFIVLILILLFAALMLRVYTRRTTEANIIALSVAGCTLAAVALSHWAVPFNVVYVLWGLCVVLAGYLIWLALRTRRRTYLLTLLFAVCSVGFLYSSEYVFNSVLEPHQQVRIQVLLGLEEDPSGAGYNVNQSKIAIGSGGLTGKGFLLHRGRRTGFHRFDGRTCPVPVAHLTPHLVGRAPADYFWPGVWIQRGQHLSVSCLHQRGHGAGTHASHRNPASFLQLRRLFAVGLQHLALHLPAHRRREKCPQIETDVLRAAPTNAEWSA